MARTVQPTADKSMQQKYIDGLEELVNLHRELSSLDCTIQIKRSEIETFKQNLTKRKAPIAEPNAVKPQKKAKSLGIINWRDLVINNFQEEFNAISDLKKQQLKESVHDFLCLKLVRQEAEQMKLNNNEYGIPANLVEPFLVWVKRQLKKSTPKKVTQAGSKVLI